ncbi:urease accessory protein UreH domain-containing protein [Brevibacillus fluminis]|uniref:urease accessory protein UreH domain-containing protein n=1 Tax=Brevibacillus fluminis TaxID=511487 RepID=UPI003F8CCB89
MILWTGFLLGIKHAIEPDHVIAVSTIASRSKNLFRSSLAGVFWGIGHTATLFVVGLILILLKGNIPEKWALSLEFTVGIMLVYLGLTNIGKAARVVQSKHVQRKKEMPYVKSVLIGLVHGLAGSAAMVLLTLSTVSTVWEGALYILIFGLGTVLGMLLFTTVIGLPFVLTLAKLPVNRALRMLTGAISTAFGFFYMYNLGITEGLFQLWWS